MNKFFLIGDWISHFFKSISTNEVQSPFLVDLHNIVIKGTIDRELKTAFLNLRKELLSENTFIHHSDFGAGSKIIKTSTTQIKNIARYSTKNFREASLIAKLLDFLNVKSVVELGTSFGLTTLLINKITSETYIHTIEGSPEIGTYASNLFSKSGNQNIRLYIEAFETALPKILKSIETIDAFIFDGNHKYQPTISYFQSALAKSNLNTVFIFDDIRWSDEMYRAWKEITNHPKTSLKIDLFNMGIVFCNPEFENKKVHMKY